MGAVMRRRLMSMRFEKWRIFHSMDGGGYGWRGKAGGGGEGKSVILRTSSIIEMMKYL